MLAAKLRATWGRTRQTNRSGPLGGEGLEVGPARSTGRPRTSSTGPWMDPNVITPKLARPAGFASG